MQSLNSKSSSHAAAAPDVVPSSCAKSLSAATEELLQEWGRFRTVTLTCSQLNDPVTASHMPPLPPYERLLEMRHIALRPWLIRNHYEGRLPYADSFAELNKFISTSSQFYQDTVPSVITWRGDSMTLKEVILLCQAFLSRARSQDFIFEGH